MTADPTPTDAYSYGRRRDDAADEVERCRAIWHTARTEVDVAKRALLDAMRAAVLAEIAYREAWARYEAVR